jgi:hypothetical protein
VRSELVAWQTPDHRDLATGAVHELTTGSVDEPAGIHRRTTVERLAGPLYLVRSEATTAGGTKARAAAIVRGIESAELWRAFPAALSAGGPVELWGGDAVHGFTSQTPARPGAESCQVTAVEEIRAAFGTLERPAILPDPDLIEPERTGPVPQLGPLADAELRRGADRYELAPVALRPAEESGLCDHGAVGNWGDPARPGAACSTCFPLIFAPGDLHLLEGAGQGILIVGGDLIISGSAQFYGAVMVSGRLELRDRAEIFGAVTNTAADGSASLASASRITYDPCALQRAFSNAAALNRAFQPHDRGWIPQF